MKALDGLPLTYVENPSFEAGMSTSLRVGVSAFSPSVEGTVIGVADQPMLRAATIDRLVAAWRRSEQGIAVPFYGGRPGNPSVYSRRHFAELMNVAGDVGGRQVRDRHGFTRVDIEAAWEGLDIDTAGDLAQVEKHLIQAHASQTPNS